MVGDPSDRALPSLVDVVRNYVSDLTLLNGQELPVWLPALPAPPPGWVLGRIDADEAPTRIALHRKAADQSWDGCEVINLFAFPGSLPYEVVPANAACTLDAVRADNISTHSLFVPPGLDATAARASGEFKMGGKRVWAQYTAYLAEEPVGSVARGHEQSKRGVLVEHNTFVTAEARPRLHHEILQMGDALDQALISALRRR
jgi:hypothetical protein